MKLYSMLAIACISSCALSPRSGSEKEQYFVREVKPVLQQHCMRCHNGALPPPALNLSTRDAAFQKRPDDRAFVVPGAPNQSLLITAVQRKGTHPKMMPRTDISLTDDQIGMLREWIEDGAVWPEGKAGRLQVQASGENP